MNRKWGLSASTVSLVVITSLALTGCEEDEVKALAKAQKCMDNLPVAVTDWEAPIACANFVTKYSSQQANIIKCAAYLTGGGLDTTRIVNAAKTLDDAGANQEAVYIAALTLNKPDDATGLTRANLAKTYCNSTGVGAFQYLGNLAVMGTTLSNIGVPFPTDPTQVNPADVQAAIDACQADAACISTIADSAGTIAESYCSNAAESDDVCQTINDAIEGAGGDSSIVGDAMLCYLEGKKVVGTNCCDQDGTSNCVAL